ncbi:hypothetical protein SLEP1_g45069 [Rubroshorea leprosula]|uniref:Uncharacterized protein n=1 Tax=Rubroshorea leprosula TaxID=152421 RepID=A0AAV5LJG1_9ROSI|nr:hypothetical protein SLEP1_g45069 [Rubroshorea leprosula]
MSKKTWSFFLLLMKFFLILLVICHRRKHRYRELQLCDQDERDYRRKMWMTEIHPLVDLLGC